MKASKKKKTKKYIKGAKLENTSEEYLNESKKKKKTKNIPEE